FSAPPALPGSGRRKSGRARLERFVGERWHPRCYLAVYDILKNIVRGRRARFVISSRTIEERCQDWERFLDQAPVPRDPTPRNHRGERRQRLRAVLHERFAWADALGEHYSHNYRSAYVLAYLLSSAAVFIALCSLFGNPKGSISKLEFTGVELVA